VALHTGRQAPLRMPSARMPSARMGDGAALAERIVRMRADHGDHDGARAAMPRPSAGVGLQEGARGPWPRPPLRAGSDAVRSEVANLLRVAVSEARKRFCIEEPDPVVAAADPARRLEGGQLAPDVVAR